MKNKVYVKDVPFLMNQWGDNPQLDPGKISASACNIKANWTCQKCNYKWSSTIKARYQTNGKCPCCDSNKVIQKGVNDIFTIVPGIRKYYDFEKNKDVDIYSQGLNSNVKIWRKCPDCGREWETAIRSCIKKVNGQYEVVECPHFNTVKRKKEDVPFISEIPSLNKFYNGHKNPSLASTIRSNSEEKVWWICPDCGHEWHMDPRSRLRGSGKCPCCGLGFVTKKGINDLFTLIPEAREFYDFEANGDFDIYSHPIRDTDIKLHWHCPKCGHKWQSAVANRIEGTYGNYKWKRCQQCYFHDTERITSISSKSYLIKRWDFKKNTDKDVNLTSAYSIDQAFWHCKKCDYEWTESINGMNTNRGSCPCCERGTVAMKGKTDVLTLVPDIKEFFDTETDYNDLDHVSPTSYKEFTWKCPRCNHTWISPISKRSRMLEDGSRAVIGCSNCGYKAFRSQTYSEQYPELAKMYNTELNGKPMDEIFGSEDHTKKFYWNCPDCGETFESILGSMTAAIRSGHCGCPYCSHTIVRKGESFADIHPEYMDEYDPDNITDPYSAFPNGKETVNWICRNDPTHRWSASFALRHSGAGKCPVCNHSYVIPEANSFAAIYPDYVDLWAPSNERTPDNTFCDSSLWLRWICPTCHNEYGGYIRNVISETESCPYCANRRVDPKRTSLQAVHPEIASKWSYKNELTADRVFPTGRFWGLWDCPECGGTYRALISEVVNGNADCPYCADRLVLPGFNSFAARHKDLMENEYDYLANYLFVDADSVSDRCTTSVWWKCPKDRTHKYQMPFATRLMFQKRSRESCPYCKGLRRKKSHFVKYEKGDAD